MQVTEVLTFLCR